MNGAGEIKIKNSIEGLKPTYSSDLEETNDLNVSLVDWCQSGKAQCDGYYLSSVSPSEEIPSEVLNENDSYTVFNYFVDKI